VNAMPNEFSYLLANLAELNSDANETIGDWYELLASCYHKRESLQNHYDEKADKMVSIKLSADDEKILSFVENLAKSNIAMLKKQSQDITLAQQMIDGIAPATNQ
jgi:hypothetical protein